MSEWADLIRAFGDLLGAILWPVVALTFLLLFREQIRALLTRLLKLKFLGQEVELERDLDKLEASVSVAAEVTTATTEATIPTEPEKTTTREYPTSRTVDNREGVIEHVLSEAALSPKVGLILLVGEIEKELRLHIAPDYLQGTIPKRPLPFLQSLEILARQGRIPKVVLSSARQFWDVRNLIMHGRDAKDDDILRAIDSGITLLRTLQAIPRETHIVYDPGVDLYADPEGQTIRDGIRGIVLDSISEGGVTTKRRVFPVVRIDFRKGEQVTWDWDWDHRNGISESWYRDPDDGQIKYAWRDSLIFAGRHLGDLSQPKP